MRRLWAWVTSRRATIGFLILSAAVLYSNLGVQHRVVVACRDRRHQYDALHAIIVKSYSPSPPPPAILKLFPQIRPIYTPGTVEYEQAQAATARRLHDVLSKLGERPSC